MAFTVKTIHAQRQIDYGNKNEHDTLVLMISKTDKSVGQLTGNLDIRDAVVFLQKKIVEEDSLDKTKWLKSNMEDYPLAWTKTPKLWVGVSLLVANAVSIPTECCPKNSEFIKRNWPGAARI